jgi:hypothetical protein
MGKKHKRKPKHPPRWKKQTLRLKDNHTWKAPDGYKIVVIDRGAVSFNIPQSWLIAKFEPHLELNDNPPPNDNARVSVSFFNFGPGIDWTGLPLAPLLLKVAEESELEILAQGEVVTSDRTDIEIVWTERQFLDPVEKRPAITRIAVARGFDLHVVITSDFWVDDLDKLKPVWDEVLRSLQLGRRIEDPTKGQVLH